MSVLYATYFRKANPLDLNPVDIVVIITSAYTIHDLYKVVLSPFLLLRNVTFLRKIAIGYMIVLFAIALVLKSMLVLVPSLILIPLMSPKVQLKEL